ncbi:hypothetical protein Lalb_Chr25g0287601 [Lupinus albus]|uniref:Knottin, scorpion toxin n=1 Tax=Lupinus albus TaxID=3870 RepID=A0A6A4NDG3_LUPAL|nr:hypothetical protein Lalb_Chr25g0287601 [Lupinus albus]
MKTSYIISHILLLLILLVGLDSNFVRGHTDGGPILESESPFVSPSDCEVSLNKKYCVAKGKCQYNSCICIFPCNNSSL